MVGLFTSPIEEAIEKATSEFLPNAQEDLASNLEVCDLIKGKRAVPKDAMRALKKRLLHRNPNVQLLALKLTDACVKNTGDHFLVELASREYVDATTTLIRPQGSTANEVRQLATSMFQTWAMLLGREANFKYFLEVYEELQRAGIAFPPPPRNLNATLVKTSAPPEWIDGNECSRCRTAFTLTLRKHHCRNCGQVFCQDCSSRQMSLPEFGIPDTVRVCETCFVRSTEQKQQTFLKSAPLPPLPLQAHSEEDQSSDEDLAKAIKLSLEESRRPSWPNPAPFNNSSKQKTREEEDEERMIAAAIEASLKDSKAPALANATADPTPTTLSSLSSGPAISNLDKENVLLFAEMVDRLLAAGATDIEPEIQTLALSMDSLKMKIKGFVLENPMANSLEISGLLNRLELALSKYQRLLIPSPYSQPPPLSAIASMPFAGGYHPQYHTQYQHPAFYQPLMMPPPSQVMPFNPLQPIPGIPSHLFNTPTTPNDYHAKTPPTAQPQPQLQQSNPTPSPQKPQPNQQQEDQPLIEL